MNLQRKLSFDSVKKYVLDIFFPNRCAFCGKVIKWSDTCCRKCFDEIPFIVTEHCKKCGQEICMCNETEIYYDGCISITDYSGIVREGIINFKLDKAVNLVDVFKDDIYKKLLSITDVNKIDVVTAVPMHRSTKRSRGYNQADIISKAVSKVINKPANSKLLIKQSSDVAQHKLNRYEREKAVKGLFSADEKHKGEIDGKTILLCDDIITTGSTLNECARILKDSGAKYVFCFTIASTRLDDGKNESI